MNMDVFEKADDWIISNCWLACFDILGFKNIISVDDEDDLKALQVRVAYEETIHHLSCNCQGFETGIINYCWFSDTFLIFTSDDSAKSYCIIQDAAKHFIEDCIYSRIPIRGAISIGSFMRTKDNRSFIGKAFLEAFEYAEDQDWLGLIITPDAIKKAESYGLYPIRHDFVRSKDIPMRNYKDQSIVAYRFQNGSANFKSPLLLMLKDMKSLSPEEYQHKYEKTIQFIEDNYSWLK